MAIGEMTERVKLSDGDFERLVRAAPLVAIDIILRNSRGQVLLALRNSPPAKNYYFVPGGRIFKNERIPAAFERIVKAETGCDIAFGAARFLGVYEHIYPDNRFSREGYGTHYIVLAHQVDLRGDIGITLDDHHSSFKWLEPEALMAMDRVHPYVKAYFKT